MVGSCPLSKGRDVRELDEYAPRTYAPKGERQEHEPGTGHRCPLDLAV